MQLANTDPGEYGPNTAQVERFLALLEQLGEADWARIEVAGRVEPRPAVPGELLLTFSGGFAKRAGDVALERAPRPGNADLLAQRAAQALALRDELGAQFEDVYRPFDEVVPLECLESDDCPHDHHRGHVVPLRGTLTSDGSE